jgi:hypothetical protein
VVIGTIVFYFNRTPPPAHQPIQPIKEARRANRIPVDTKNVAVPNGYRELAQTLANAAHNLGRAAKYKDEVATKWMRLKGIRTDSAFGSFLVGLMDRVHEPAVDTIEDADRLVAEGQLQLALALATKENPQARANLWEVSEKLKRLVGEPSSRVPVPAVSKPVPGKKATTQEVETLAPTKVRPATTPRNKADEPTADKSPEEAARNKYGFLIKQAEELIRSNLNSAAKAKLQRVIDGAPGTQIAADAKTLLDTIPPN